MTTTVMSAIRHRRSIKAFTHREVDRAEVEALLEAAVLAPNHRMTEPWQFLVLGPLARRAYAETLAARKARKVDEPEAAAAVREKVLRGHDSVPCMIAVTMHLDPDPEIREEDYAACYMAVENMALAAVEMGLGTQIKSGAVMDDAALRSAFSVPESRRVVCIVFVGEPAELPAPKERVPATERTRWLD